MRRRPAAWMLAGCAIPLALACGARAEETTRGSAPYNTTARLDFTVTVGKFLYLRVGATGGTVNTVGFSFAPSIPGSPTAPATGNNTATDWSGTAPTFSVTASNNVLPVEVQSNAGAVSLRATVLAPLSNGSATIPMTAVSIASSNSGLPAPPLPASGTGSSVNVAGTAFSNLVTQQTANWTFSMASASYPAGNYSGQLQFTASAP